MNLKKAPLIIVIITFILLNTIIVCATNTNKENIQNIFRIHVVANSDSIDDQIIKYNVAKNVEEYVNNITSKSHSKTESKKNIEENINNILTICNNTLSEFGSNSTVKAYIGNMMYEEKTKNNISMNSRNI